jgi:mono/diheme cytochrome c family protein/plastocyanin
MVKLRERVALVVLMLILVGTPLAVLGYQYVLRPALAPHRIIDILAAVPESGGFQPDSIHVAAGETVTLRFSAADVTHGVAIGPGLGVDLGHIDPGHVADVTLTFDQGGTYTFYCNSWCSPNHWRMRGVIEVQDTLNPPQPVRDPVIEALVAEGVDIDAVHNALPEHDASADVPHTPSAERGANLSASMTIPPELLDTERRRRLTPMQALDALQAANSGATQADLADVVGYLWTRNAPSEQAVDAATLYAKNCAACHGETGGGDGPASMLLPTPPAAFSDAATMFSRRSDVLYAKIRRGGMGTNMPNFGTLFTQEETWALVDYLWSLTFPKEE